MTPPLPPPGYEIVEDEPREGDMAWLWDEWFFVDACGSIDINKYSFDANIIPGSDLRWIARKIWS